MITFGIDLPIVEITIILQAVIILALYKVIKQNDRYSKRKQAVNKIKKEYQKDRDMP